MKEPILVYSPLDSSRFGMKIFRGNAETFDVKHLAREIIVSKCDVAIVRMPSAHSSVLSELSNWGLPVIHADTLTYYKCDLERYTPAPLKNSDIKFAKGSESDKSELREIVAVTFRDYVSHYHSNKMFPPEDILAGYQEWAEGHVIAEGEVLWTARREGRLVAFAACRDNSDTRETEGVLYGVNPKDAGGGLYGDLIRYTQTDAKSRGMRSMKVSTQVGNFAVQKVWTREGFHLFQALDTFHINAQLSCGEVLIERSLSFSGKDIERFAEASRDVNPIHLDEAAARSAGFPSRIAHGVMGAAEISRILGTEVPGPGTILTRLDLVFLRPLIADGAYILSMRAPMGLKASGPAQVVVTISEPSGLVCFTARAHIFKHS